MILQILAILLFTQVISAQFDDSLAQLWIERKVYPDTMYFDDTAKVKIKLWASNDTIFFRAPRVDFLLLSDNGSFMGKRQYGDRNWINPSRIQAAYNACVNVIDSIGCQCDRIGHIRFASCSDTLFNFRDTSRDPDFILAKEIIDTFVNGQNIDADGFGRNSRCQGVALWDAIYNAVEYVMAEKIPDALPVIFILTAGRDNSSTLNYQDVINLLTALEPNNRPKIFVINIQSTESSAELKEIADTSGGAWYDSLETIYQSCPNLRFIRTIAMCLGPNDPLLLDVLGPDVFYVPSSFIVNVDSVNHIWPNRISLGVDTVTSSDGGENYVRLNINVDSINVGEVLEVEYKITVNLDTPDIFNPQMMRTNNTMSDDSVNYSLVQYKNLNYLKVLKPLPKDTLYIKSRVGGLYLSLDPDSVITPSPSKVISLMYGFNTPAVYPQTTIYSVIEHIATNYSYKYTPIQSIWNFNPNANWTAPVLVNVQDSSQNVGVTVPYDYADQCTLKIEYLDKNVIYSDFLIFSAFDTFSGPCSPPVMMITDDTVNLNILTNIRIIGDTSYLNT